MPLQGVPIALLGLVAVAAIALVISFRFTQNCSGRKLITSALIFLAISALAIVTNVIPEWAHIENRTRRRAATASGNQCLVVAGTCQHGNPGNGRFVLAWFVQRPGHSETPEGRPRRRLLYCRTFRHRCLRIRTTGDRPARNVRRRGGCSWLRIAEYAERPFSPVLR